MPDFHQDLIDLRNNLGYSKNEDGVCALYAEKGIDAWLGGPANYQAFEERKSLIQKQTKLAQLSKELHEFIKNQALKEKQAHPKETIIKVPVTEEQQQILDAESFIDEGELYLFTKDYPGVFGRFVSQPEILEISEIAQSDEIKKQGGRARLIKFVGIYSEDELKKYVSVFARAAIAHGIRFALSLGSDNHRINLCYNELNKSFLVMDANQPFLKPVFVNNLNDAKPISILAKQLFNAFEFGKDGATFTAFTTNLLTTGNHAKLAEPLVRALQADKDFIELHTVTPELAKRKTLRNISLAWMAAKVNDLMTLQNVIDSKPSGELPDLNLSNGENVTPLYIASQNGYPEAVELLLNAKTPDGKLRVDPDTLVKNYSGFTAAAQFGYGKVLEVYAQAKASDGKERFDLNQKTKTGYTSAFLAAMNGCAESLKVLINAKTANDEFRVDLNEGSEEGTTPACMAAQEGELGALQLLADAKTADGEFRVDLNRANKLGTTPLIKAAAFNHKAVLKYLINAKLPNGEYRVDANQANKEGTTAAYQAILCDDIKIFKLLLKAKTPDGKQRVDIDCADIDGMTPLYIAALQGKAALVQMMVDAKTEDGKPRVDLNKKSNQGVTPAVAAAEGGMVDVLQVLMKAKTADGKDRVDMNADYNNGVTPVFMAAQNNHVKALQLLVDAKTYDGKLRINLDMPNSSGLTPFLTAALHGNKEILQILMDAKTTDGIYRVDVNKLSIKDDSAALLAAQEGHDELLQMLVDAKTVDGKFRVDLNIPDLDGVTPLHTAAQEGKLTTLQILLNAKDEHGKARVNVNQHTHAGFSPVYLAAREGHVEALKILEESGADMVSPANGTTPLDAARAQGKQDVIDFYKAREKRDQLFKRLDKILLTSTEYHNNYALLKHKVEMMKNTVMQQFREGHKLFLRPNYFDWEILNIALNGQPSLFLSTYLTLFPVASANNLAMKTVEQFSNQAILVK